MNTTNFLKLISISTSNYAYSSSSNALDKVNKSLELGWKLVDTYTTCLEDNTENQTIHYVLGWDKSNGSIVYPE